MDRGQISNYHAGGRAELYKSRDRLRIIAKAFKDYIANNKAIEEFEEEYGCNIIYDENSNGIMDVVFHNSRNETMFMLKYNK